MRDRISEKRISEILHKFKNESFAYETAIQI
jgi:hypothetical protein